MPILTARNVKDENLAALSAYWGRIEQLYKSRIITPEKYQEYFEVYKRLLGPAFAGEEIRDQIPEIKEDDEQEDIVPPPGDDKVPEDPSELAGNFGAYMAAIGLSGKTYLDMMEKTRESQYGRLKNLYDVIVRMQNIPAESPGGTTSYFNQEGIGEPGLWTDWIKGVTEQGTQPADIGRTAQALMRTLVGANKEQRALSGTTYEPRFNEQGNIVQGTDTLGELQRLLISALKPKWGYGGAAQAASNVGLFQNQWLAQKAQGQADLGTFIDYIINKMGLNREGLF